MMNCLAIDDEPLALRLLEFNIEKVSYLNLVASCENAFDAMEALSANSIDLVFIDIQMPGLSGLQFIASLEKKPLVIFITAYKQYAIESYDLSVVDYLLKPVALERFIKACNRAHELFLLKSGATTKPVKTGRDHFFVPMDFGQHKVKFDDIIWVKGFGDYLKIYLKNEAHPLVVRITFKELEIELPENFLLRIHKSYGVALNAITSIRKGSIFIDELELSIGDAFRERVEEVVLNKRNRM
ncbi:LytR/AlgR family response regulator transcription factor [Algoriphagus chordae]|uniref:LytTR family two component transcriptional regulator n=1 Tax=Algoriphagus chordae TaxID=237019 RepID=A0A2W7QJK2_9BACT|nr:LytTR family DNA-binding domain-containing protein [Algoriphagus chordae]PZX48523.1 LytTR family two component transcriptional regulator [Algoriphagus chordae]